MIHRNRFMAVALSISMIAQIVLPGAVTTVYGDQKNINETNIVPVIMQSDEELVLDEQIVPEFEDGDEYITVTLNANGGYFKNADSKDDTAKIINKVGESVYLGGYSSLQSEDDHKIFVGWSDAAAGEVTYKMYDTLSLTENKTLYAVWKNAYRVTLHSSEDGGVPQGVMYSGGDEYSVITEVDSKGDSYENNWYADERTYLVLENSKALFNRGFADERLCLTKWISLDDDSIEYKTQEGSYTITSDMDLYAVYEEGYNVHLKVNNGILTGSGSFHPTDGWCQIRESDRIYNFEKEEFQATYCDYVFSKDCNAVLPGINAAYPNDSTKCLMGWSPTEDGKVVYLPSDSIKISGDMTFYAVYGDGYEVTFDANGGKINGKSTEINNYSPGRSLSLEDMYNTSSVVFQDESKEFVGWALKPDADAALESYTITKDMTFYAVWVDVTNITLKVQGAKISYQGGEPTDEVKIKCYEGGSIKTKCECDEWNNDGNRTVWRW